MTIADYERAKAFTHHPDGHTSAMILSEDECAICWLGKALAEVARLRHVLRVIADREGGMPTGVLAFAALQGPNSELQES